MVKYFVWIPKKMIKRSFHLVKKFGVLICATNEVNFQKQQMTTRERRIKKLAELFVKQRNWIALAYFIPGTAMLGKLKVE